MDVVLVGVALFFVMHFLAPPDFHVLYVCTHAIDQSQGCGVGDVGMRNVDCREEQKWLPISSP